MVTHVFFDFFGTLVEYDPSVTTSGWNAPQGFGRSLGVEISTDEADQLWQRAWAELEPEAVTTGVEYSMSDVADRFRRLLGSPEVGRGETERFVDEYLGAWSAGIRLAEGAISCLSDLSIDHKLSVVSNTHHASLVPTLIRRFDLNGYIGHVVTSIEVGWRKPHPEIFRGALDLHGVTAADVAFVGDNWIADVEGPRIMGMSAYYVGQSVAAESPVTLMQLPELIRRQH